MVRYTFPDGQVVVLKPAGVPPARLSEPPPFQQGLAPFAKNVQSMLSLELLQSPQQPARTPIPHRLTDSPISKLIDAFAWPSAGANEKPREDRCLQHTSKHDAQDQVAAVGSMGLSSASCSRLTSPVSSLAVAGVPCQRAPMLGAVISPPPICPQSKASSTDEVAQDQCAQIAATPSTRSCPDTPCESPISARIISGKGSVWQWPTPSDLNPDSSHSPISECSSIDLNKAWPYASELGNKTDAPDSRPPSPPRPPESDQDDDEFIDGYTALPKGLFEELLICGQQARARGCHVLVRDELLKKDELVRIDLCVFG